MRLAKLQGWMRAAVLSQGTKMAKLTTKQRKHLPKSDFALSGGRYPINDASHARNALARVSQHGSPAQKTKVRAAVHKRYPAIGQKKRKA